MHGHQHLHRFDFNDNGPIHQQVDSVTRIQCDALVNDRQRRLPVNAQSPQLQFLHKAMLVGGLQESRPEQTMHSQGGRHDFTPDGFRTFCDCFVNLDLP